VPSRLDADERRRQILASAQQLLSSRPYDEVSMHDLAEAAGVARGLLNHYFGSKRDLYLAVVRESVRLPSLPEGELWEASVDRWLQMIEANRSLWIAAINASGIGVDPEVQSIIDESKEVVSEQALRALGVDSPTDAQRAAARGFGGLTEELTREWLVKERVTREQVRAMLAVALPVLVRALP
jgi:AcrR family transcriptional regulator